MGTVKLLKSIYTSSDPTALGELQTGDSFVIPSDFTETIYSPIANNTFTVDLTNGTIHKFTTNANTTINLPASVAGKSYMVIISYGGSHTLTWVSTSTIKWVNGSAPTSTSVNGKFDIFCFVCDGTNIYGASGGANY
jgi:hypothetical protein